MAATARGRARRPTGTRPGVALSQVRELARGMERAWNRHDAPGFAALFAPDAEFTNVVGKRVVGTRGIFRLHAPGFRVAYSRSRLIMRVERVRRLDPRWASVDLRWRLRGTLDSAGTPRPVRTGLMNWVVSTERRRWRIVVSHNQELSASLAK